MEPKRVQPQWKTVVFRLFVATISSLIFALNFKSFVQAGDLFPGGFTGLARLLQRVAMEYWDLDLPFTPINLLCNAGPIYIGYKFVGKRFTFYSCVVTVLTSIFTDLIPAFHITEDILLVCVFGGLVQGVGAGIYLNGGISGGGTDFIAIALAERKNIDAWNYILCANVAMLVVAGLLFGWERALYSIIFQFTSTQVVKAMDPQGRRATLFIVTGREQAGGVCAQIQDTNHSATLIEGVGLYNGSSCVLIYSVVANSQVRWLTRKVKQADPNAFINVIRTDKLVGRFYRNPRE